jgi:hypothetical protein
MVPRVVLFLLHQFIVSRGGTGFTLDTANHFMEKTKIAFEFLEQTYYADVEYFEPPGVMPYYKAEVSDEKLIQEFGMIHNFKEKMQNGYIVLEPAMEPQGKYHAYFWSCLMSEIYILLLNIEALTE